MKVIVTGDWHPDRSTAGYSRFDDVREAVGVTVDHANKVGPSLYVFDGDLCDPDSSDLVRSIVMAQQAAIALDGESLWVAGNHDVIDSGRGDTVLDPLESVPDAVVATRPVLREFGVGGEALTVACFPYVEAALSYDPIAVLTEFGKQIANGGWSAVKLVVSHLMLEGIEPGNETEDMPRGRDVFLPVDAVRSAFPEAVIVNGHYHRAQVFRGVYLPGSIVNLTKADANHTPGFLEIDI